MPKPPAELRIGLELDLGNPAQHHVADMHCVAHGLQGQRMLLETGDEVEPRAVTEREHQMIVGKRDLARERRRGHRLSHGVDLTHAAHHKAGLIDHLADRRDDLLGKDRCAERFRKHRVERHMAFLADEEQPAAGRQPAIERAQQRRTGESAADNNDVLPGIHREAPPSVDPLGRETLDRCCKLLSRVAHADEIVRRVDDALHSLLLHLARRAEARLAT